MYRDHASPLTTTPAHDPLTAVRPVVFAYGFPHKKTQDVILRLVSLGWRPLAVLAAPWEPLGGAPPAVRVKPRHVDLMPPEELCRTLGIEYHLIDHRSESCLLLLDWLQPKVAVIAGARVLPRAVLDYFPLGVVNLHPGLLPDVRGLDAMLWSLYHQVPLGVTAHIVDERVDAGWIIERRLIEVYGDDSLVDLSLRLHETQLDMLGSALTTAVTTDRYSLEAVSGGPYRSAFPAALVGVLPERLEQLRQRSGRMGRAEGSLARAL